MPDPPIFVHRKGKNEGVENAEHDQQQRMGESEAIELVDDVAAENDEAHWVGPEPLSQEAVDEHDFHDAVSEEIEGHEIMLGNREGVPELQKMGRDPPVGVAAER